ncbi:DUF600 domain-containing protein [Bacillus sp. A116_S68]|nr:DUF600 domain-containing protein [Bacillus sp. A116_S68]
MVSICLEYVENRADEIYIYCSFEEKTISCDFFYCIDGKIVERNKLNDVIDSEEGFKYDTSGNRQTGVLKILNEDIKEMIKLCEEYNKEMPTEIKLIYNVVDNTLKADYRYDVVYSNHPEKLPHDVSMEWFEEVKSDM